MEANETFGRYQLMTVAGTGGMALVHLARQIGPQGFVKPCVLKRIAPSCIHDERVRKMFLEEARVSAILNHPHIVQTFDYGEVDGVPYMAMELVDGVNLAQLCRTLANEGRWIPLRTCVDIVLSVLEALAYAHTLHDLNGRPLNLIHRDVSPQNILLSRQGGVKLADFGIARHDARDEVTQGLATKGKPGYMAPEQGFGQEIDPRADLFALGVVLVELISARRLLKGMSYSTGIASLPMRVRDLLQLRDDAPQLLKDFAMRMTALEPQYRPMDARSASEDLRKIAQKIPVRESLSSFLEKVFARFFPSGILDPTQPTTNPSAVPVSDLRVPDAHPATEPDRTIIDPAMFPEPPEAEKKDLQFERDSWKREGAPEGTAVVYEGGWPKEYLEKEQPPQLELVARSSSVDAMQFFGAQGTSAAPQPAPMKTPAPDVVGHPVRMPYNPKRGSTTGSLGPAPTPAADRVPSRDIISHSRDLVADAGSQALSARLGALLPTPAPPEKSGLRIPPWLPLAAIALVVATAGVGILALLSPGRQNKTEEKAQSGSIFVSSSVPGARISVDGQETAMKTPFEMAGLPLDRPIRLSVALEGYLPVPADALVIVPSSSARTTASFTMVRGRIFELETEPAGANVEMNGERLSGITPLQLPPVALGTTASIAVTLDGHMPLVLHIPSRADTATTARVKLEAAKVVDIVSEPPNAKVFVENTLRGTTPLYDLLVPASRLFRVRVEKRGYKTWKQQLSAKTMRTRQVEADLQVLPLLAMPLSRDEMKEAKEYDRKLAHIRAETLRAKSTLARAEKRLSDIESSTSNVFVGRIADAQRMVDEARSKIEELEQEQQETETSLTDFRQRIMAKIDGEGGG
jgi:serine/threonine-protein kinase